MTPRFWYIRGLSNLDDALHTELRKEARVERWGHRAAVRLRDDPDEVQTVLNGKLILADGAYDANATLTPGDVFGLYTADTDAGALQALDDLHIATLSRPRFESLVGEHAGNLAASVGVVRRKKLSVPVSHLWYSGPRRRVAAIVLHLIESVGATRESQGRLDFLPTTRTLARLTGLAEPTVLAIVEGMQRDNVLELRRGELVAPDMDVLRQIALE